MELRQLRTMITLVNLDFSVSRSAEHLFLVQSAVSQQIKRLEIELGSDIFVRKGKRLIGLTQLGKAIESQAQQAVVSTNNIHQIAKDYHKISEGILRIGCTHTQARYILAPVLKAFNKEFPEIELEIHQGNPRQLVNWAETEQVDFSICTEEIAQSKKLESIACYRWNRSLITRPNHPILQQKRVSLADLAKYPIITYVMGFTGRQHFNDMFLQSGITANIVLSAADTDIIKTYVLDDMGIGVIAGMAYTAEADKTLVRKDLSHLFPWETTRIAYQKSKHLRRYEKTFIDGFLAIVKQKNSSYLKAV